MSERASVRARRGSPTSPVAASSAAVWDGITLLPNPLPEIDRDEVRTSLRFLGRDCALPFLLLAREAQADPSPLAALAQRYGAPLSLGDISGLLADSGRQTPLRRAREVAPEALLLGEIAATALLPGPDAAPIDPDLLRDALVEIGIDGLIVTLDFADVALTNARRPNAIGATEVVGDLARTLRLPVLLRSAIGIPRQQARGLVSRGIAGLIVAGSESFDGQGPSEAARGNARRAADQRAVFSGWGIPTLAAVRMLRAVGAPLVSDGGIRSGLDAAKALTLGADLVGITPPADAASEEDGAKAAVALERWLAGFVEVLRITMFLTGAARLATLKQVPFIATGPTREWLEAAESVWRLDALGSTPG